MQIKEALQQGGVPCLNFQTILLRIVKISVSKVIMKTLEIVIIEVNGLEEEDENEDLEVQDLKVKQVPEVVGSKPSAISCFESLRSFF